MKIIAILFLSILLLTSCNSDTEIEVLNQLFSVELPVPMEEFEKIDSIPEYLIPLFEIRSKECQFFEGSGEFFSIFIVDATSREKKEILENEGKVFRDIFELVYSFAEFSNSGRIIDDNTIYYYELFQLKFSVGEYTVFQSVFSLDNKLIYMNLWHEDGDIDSMIEQGINILRSIRR